MSAPLRGQVYWADLGFGAKPWLVVSNNDRNRALSDLRGPTCAVRLARSDLRGPDHHH
jgi:mRNA-degrading endonuclease toxin of MazEF toxin-antitoxin module